MNETSLPEYLTDEQWNSLLEELPDGWEEAAKEQKAIQRKLSGHSDAGKAKSVGFAYTFWLLTCSHAHPLGA